MAKHEIANQDTAIDESGWGERTGGKQLVYKSVTSCLTLTFVLADKSTFIGGHFFLDEAAEVKGIIDDMITKLNERKLDSIYMIGMVLFWGPQNMKGSWQEHWGGMKTVPNQINDYVKGETKVDVEIVDTTTSDGVEIKFGYFTDSGAPEKGKQLGILDKKSETTLVGYWPG